MRSASISSDPVKYADEPLTGRPGDGENYSIGFTTVVDGPYPEMVEAAKK